MSEHCGYIVKVNQLRPHSNADRLQIATFFGNDTCVGLDVTLGEIGIYFPSDLQLSQKFAEANNLLRKKDENGNNIGGFLDPDKRNVTAIRLRGEKSEGLFLPLKSLETFGDISILKEGDRIDNFNGHEICCKYIPRRKARNGATNSGNRTRKTKVNIAPLFVEHADTEQLAYNLNAFKPGDEIEITLKMHGTSQRTGYLPMLKGYKKTLLDKILRREGTPIYDWDYVSGTRRVVLDDYEGGYYGSNEFRQRHHEAFYGKLNKGETVYYEVVGFTHTGVPIMGNGNNEKVGKDFVKQYGKETIFSYGCEPNPSLVISEGETTINLMGKDIPAARYVSVEEKLPQSDIYVYRMTMTNEDGFVVEYTPDYMRYRCEQMGIKCVPVFWKGIIPSNEAEMGMRHDHDEFPIDAGKWILNKAEEFYDGPDPIGKTHTREGVVVRILNRPKFCAYKHKNFEFKVLEGIIKDTASAPDMEEAQDTTE